MKGHPCSLPPLAHAAQNDYLAERFRKAYEFLSRDDLAALPLGRVDIDGDDVFANVQEYETVPAPDKRMEAHRRYYDVQFVVSGEELIQYAPLEGMIEIGSFDEDSDFGVYGTPPGCSSIVLRAGQIAVFAPEDGHKPGCSFGAAKHVRKIVVKVRV
ncbi:YhcH/YjgK/YiaL family protein [Paraeggerthella sp.]|uniref:YhcH/YjgK/YiaL family protein n=1 Tax=Paraeggerthella sp. TaxID=2897350 RepID=UPI00352890CD